MPDLNRMHSLSRTGWESLEFWLESFNYWSGVGNAENTAYAADQIDNILFS